MAEERVQRRLAALLAAGVAGYSKLMGLEEEGTLAALTAHRTELIEPCIAEHRGRVVKTTGDGLLAEFASVVDAVRCAVAFQEGMEERNTDTPEDIITALSRLRGFFVIARDTMLAYQAVSPDARTIAVDLGVRYILEGGVRTAGKRVRATTQLTEASTGNQLWGDRYDVIWKMFSPSRTRYLRVSSDAWSRNRMRQSTPATTQAATMPGRVGVLHPGHVSRQPAF